VVGPRVQMGLKLRIYLIKTAPAGCMEPGGGVQGVLLAGARRVVSPGIVYAVQ
jgi:hypothetical protein